VEAIRRHWNIDSRQLSEILGVLSVKKNVNEELKKEDFIRSARGRISAVFELHDLIMAFNPDRNSAERWMKSPSAHLSGFTPLELACSGKAGVDEAIEAARRDKAGKI